MVGAFVTFHSLILGSIAPTDRERAEMIGHGCTRFNVKNWKSDGRIPLPWIAFVVDACRRAGHEVTAEQMIKKKAFTLNLRQHLNEVGDYVGPNELLP